MIQIKKTHQGMLHEALGVPKGEKISVGALMQAKARAKKTGNAKLMKQATFAANAREWNS